MLSDVGALTAAFTWSAPEERERNGEIVAYQLVFNSPEWLAPRELTVADALNYTLTGNSQAFVFTVKFGVAHLNKRHKYMRLNRSIRGESNFFVQQGITLVTYTINFD